MNFKLKFSIGLLTLGLIFSSIIRVRFNISNDFEMLNFWITIPLPIFDIAAKSSNQMALTSTSLGYLFFAIFGFSLISNLKALISKDIVLSVFLILTIIALGFELASFIQDLNLNFVGQHARIGPTIFLMGLWILVRRN